MDMGVGTTMSMYQSKFQSELLKRAVHKHNGPCRLKYIFYSINPCFRKLSQQQRDLIEQFVSTENVSGSVNVERREEGNGLCACLCSNLRCSVSACFFSC